MEWGRSQIWLIQNIEIVWGAIVYPRVIMPRPSSNLPLYSIIFCYHLVTDHFWDSRGGGEFVESLENYFFKNYFQTPRVTVHTIFLVALPHEMNQPASFAIVRAGRNGMGSVSDLEHSKHRNCLGSNNTPGHVCPALCKSTPLFNNILLPIS